MRLARQRVFFQRRRRARRCHRFRRLAIEPLEARWLLAVLTVDSTADIVDPQDGLLTLREAIIAANENASISAEGDVNEADEIRFAPSLFAAGPATITLTQGELSITGPLAIIGPGADLLTIDASGNDPTPNSTIADGNSTNDGDGSRVFNVDDNNAATKIVVAINDLTITGGDTKLFGGGILNREALTLDGCIVANNAAAFNASGAAGGGVANIGGSLTIHTTQISGNSSDGGAFGNGFGGGILNRGTLILTDSTVSGNTTDGPGGGIFSSGDVTIERSTISSNVAQGDGAGILSRDSDLTITSSTISGNRSAANGGGISLVTFAVDTAAIVHSTIANNTADDENNGVGSGGGIHSLGAGQVKLSHTIVADNIDRSDSAPDLDFSASDQEAPAVSFCLIGDNRRSGLAAAPVGSPDADGNLIGDVTSGGAIDPLLGPLADNGGSTQSHTLLAGSPAIDTGNPAAAAGTGAPQFDQRGNGFARILGAGIDIGAFEGLGITEPPPQPTIVFLPPSAVASIPPPVFEPDAEEPLEIAASLLLTIALEPPPLFPVSDGGAGGGTPTFAEREASLLSLAMLADRAMQTVYYGPRAVEREEVIDVVFSLGELEAVSLLGVDMGDDPVFKPRVKQAKAETEVPVEDQIAQSPIEQAVAEVPTAPGWKSLVLWAALAGSCTLWISGTWWWMHRGRKTPH